ncbi:MFS general substrate transporter [Aspergillus fijiensis CBS 313.89]|uniref:MFS general substrate transporter n=1 Tax=Aspergillus fijiensis CBS 313.89 TaxID=1448319 RepID=A0A8G1W308_9EURO|nr:MFS general substrate transporter [Aspergillus fijiensis CBS 313.89]RAK81243.1 MFS general substrate transporter [Aspergillus fijiensis CBS 313.89]
MTAMDRLNTSPTGEEKGRPKEDQYTYEEAEKDPNMHKGTASEEGDTDGVFTYSAEEERCVKRKIDLILLPLLCMCYVFSFLDKTLLNYSSIFGIKSALHLTGSDYSWLGSAFYLGYIVGALMWAKLVQRWPQHVGKFISGAVTVWACITLLTPLCYNFVGILVVRLFLGLVESIIGPVFVIVTSKWWTRSEQAFRTAFWLGGTPIGNFCGGLISYGLGSMHPSFPTWKLFFVFFGALGLAYAVVLSLLMPDTQANARWLTPKERRIAADRVRANHTGNSNTNEWKWPQFWEALRDPQTTMFFVTAFSSQIVSGFGFSTLETTIVSTCPAAVIQLSTFLVFSYIASHRPNIRLGLSMLVSVPPLIGASLLHALPLENRAGRLAGYYLTYTHTMSFTLNTSLMASNYAGNTKKATANGVIFAGWAAGLVAGPQFFLDSQAPVYELAFRMLMGTYALMIIVPCFQLAWYNYENRRREQLSTGRHHPGQAGGEDEDDDRTDFEQWETFRYVV